VTGDGELALAQRALGYLDGDQAQATVTSERSLLSRFARSAATQATAIDDTSVELLCVLDGHTGAASTNQLDDEGLAVAANRARAAAAAGARSGSGPYPGLPGPAATRPHEGFDPATAMLDPAEAGARVERRVRMRRHGRARGVRHLDRRLRCEPRSPRAPASRSPTRSPMRT